ncbi:ribonuclease H-like domain-containing protein [Tanacetum coccineum]
MCDASEFTVRAVLGQKDGNHFHPIYFASKTLIAAQQNNTVTEKELMTVVFIFNKFQPYLVLSKTIVYTNHSALRHLFKKQNAKLRLIRWILLLQEFNIEIKDKKGIENVVADHLSRIENDETSDNDDEIDDNFPGETLIEISTRDIPWSADFANYLVKIDDPNITMEEYIRLEEEKPRRCGKVYNWETARYCKIWYDDDIHDLRSVETEFPAIVFNDELSSERTLSCEPTVSSLNNNEIDFRLSFDESDDEDYTVIFDKNSFSYKIISINDLKMDSENDNEKVNMPSFSSPDPTVSYFDDLDFLKDFENEFPAIVYKDALTSKSNSSTEPVEIPHCIDEFDLKTETSLSECDEEEQNIIYFNDLFSFNIIYLDDSKSDKDNDDHEIDIKQSSGGNVSQYGVFQFMDTAYWFPVQDLAAKKSTKLVKYQSSGILCVIVVKLEYRRIHNTHSCS